MYDISTGLIRTKHNALMKCELCNFSASMYELYAPIFALKLALHNIKINGKIHAYNLKF